MSMKDLRLAFQKGWRGICALFIILINELKNLHKKVSKLETKNQSLETKNQSLETKNQELEEKLKKYINERSKDSQNSSKPPSTDGFKKKTKSLRNKSERKSGGQKGHKGSTLEIQENPDFIIFLKLSSCKCCNRNLPEKNKKYIIHQVIDIEDGKRKITEYRAEYATCPGCGVESTAEFDSFCAKKVQYGVNIKSLVVYFNKYHLIPLNRIVEILSDLYHIKISQGSIVNFNSQLFEKLEGFENECKEALLQSEVIHADESGGRCEKTLHWFQVVSNEFLTFIAFHKKRGTEAMNEIGILSKYDGKAVHDFFKSYFKFDFEHILCNAHLLRELIFESEQNKQKWASEMIALLLAIKSTVEKEKAKGTVNSLSKYYLRKYEIEFDKILKKGYRKNPYQNKAQPTRGRAKQSASRNLLDRLYEHKFSYLGFMYDFNIPFDNNLAERDIRMLKLYMKISGCFRTPNGAMYFCRIRSYISTARKNNLNVLESIQSAFKGNHFSLKNS